MNINLCYWDETICPPSPNMQSVKEIVKRAKNHRWIKKFKEKLPITTEKKRRNLVAIDATVVKANEKRYYVYAAIDVKRNELILMRVYTTRNYLTTKSFVKEVLEYCENKPRFVVDND